MKYLQQILFSTRTMTVLLLLYGFAMAAATFVESSYDTPTAKTLIYNAIWFELLMFWLVALFAANIKTYRLTRMEKWPLLVFHLAFIFMFIGGAVTRYTSFEGQMPIEEGQTTNEIISDLTYFKLSVTDGNKILKYDRYPYMMSYFNSKATSWPLKRTFKQRYLFDDKIITLKTLDYIPLAKDSIQITKSGKKMLNVVSIADGARMDNTIYEGEVKEINGIIFSYNNPVTGSVQLREMDNVMTLTFSDDGHYLSMEGQQKGVVANPELLSRNSGTIKANETIPLNYRTLYNINNTSFIVPEKPINGKTVYYSGDKNDPMDQNLLEAIQLELTSGGEIDTVLIKGGKGVIELDKTVKINGLDVSLGFGSKIIHTDFSLRCDDFLLERYPGSNNPSSYESRITIIDAGQEKRHHIYMNNVLDYRGYRFFQASYFPDESGTILSVNADWRGTNITYVGYFLLFIGMFSTLFWKGTHLWKLNNSLKKIKGKSLALVPLWLFFGLVLGMNLSFAQHSDLQIENSITSSREKPQPHTQFIRPDELGANRTIDPGHAEKFGGLLVQDFQGRIKPMNTHTLELLRKIYKKDSYQKGSTSISSDQWFISMQVDPGYWVNKPLINVGEKGGDRLRQETKANAEGYTSYANLVGENTGIYKLENQYNQSFSKRKADQTNYDKSIIAVTERFHIFSSVAFGYYMNVIPVKNDPAQTWISWIYSSKDYAAEINPTAYSLLTPYFDGVKQGLITGDWGEADKRLSEITDFQQTWGENILPSASKVKLEIIYNQLNAFFWLMIIYSLLGMAMVVLGFADVFSSGSKYHPIIEASSKFLLGLMVLALVFQVMVLGVRWYLSGHAPWSNGYEAIIFISGVGVFAGLLLYRNRNAFIPAAGALVATIMMGFAHGGSMLDPQITPLEPVLKSYWLMIHVGIITSSYGFFGLSALLASISLILFSVKRTGKIERSIKELTIVNEMALTVGIFALTIGTFLGGMWANESWGRYWSWDPKETWAFISVILYAVVLHLRLVPKLKGKLLFNAASLWAIWSIIFTYFGVNYYLVGLHSYAAGDAIPVPAWIYITGATMFILSLTAFLRTKASRQ